MLIERRDQRLYASYNQFYIEDKNGLGDTSSSDFWTPEAFRNKVAVVPGTVGIGTGTYGDVRVYTEIHDTPPPVDLAVWDHVTEAGLDVKSGMVRVIGCLDVQEENFAISPGSYRVRCCHADLAEANDTGGGGDWYVVQVWPAPLMPPIVLKHFADKSH